MKKLSIFLLALVACAGTMFASAIYKGGIWYNFDHGNRTAEVTYRGPSYYAFPNEYTGDVVIPSSVTYNEVEYSVTSIGWGAFYDSSGLISVTIPNSVTSIGDEAFWNCTGLTSVTIGNSVTSIGSSAFYRCSGLTSVTIPNSVTRIGDKAFNDCSGLTSVTIPNSVTSIGGSAFSGCRGLTSVSIPNSVTSIGWGAFSYCSNLTTIDVAPDNPYYCSEEGVLFNRDKTTLVAYPTGKQGGKYTIPNSVTRIGGSAFEGCTGLTSIEIPNSVTSIGNSAFYWCSGLTSVTIPNSVTSIGTSAFFGCSGLTSITNYATTPQSINSNVFTGVNIFTCILNVPKESVDLYKAAEGWKEFTNVDVPKDNYVGGIWYNFDDEHLTAEVTFQGAYFDSYLDEYSGEVVIPSSVTYNAQTYTVTSIGEFAFYWCDGLTAVTIPNSVTSIGNSAFEFCSGLTSVTIPNSVTSIGDDAFHQCTGLTSLSVEAGNTVYDSRNNCNAIIETSTNTLIFGCQNTTISNTVTSIGDGAFNGCSGLTSVTIPNSVTSIGSSAFSGCSGLKAIYCESSTPAIIATNTFPSAPIYVPQCAYTTYQNAPIWKDLTLSPVDVNLAVVNNTGGVVNETCGSMEIEAIPYIGYHFKRWQDGNKENPRKYKLSQSNRNFIAEFEMDKYTITLNCDDSQGSITGDKGKFNYDTDHTIEAVANYGYHFTQWSDGETENPREFTLEQDTTFTALFAPNKYSLAIQYDNSYGEVEGEEGEFDYLSEHTIAVNAKYGYHLVSWSDGVTDNPRTLVLTKDTAITATFAPNKYQLEVIADAEAGAIIGTQGEFDYLTEHEFKAVANDGYLFLSWSDGNTENPRTIILTRDTSFIALFENNMHTISLNCDAERGSVNLTGEGVHLQSCTIEALPLYGYHFSQWTDGNTDNPRTFVVTQDTTFTAEFDIDRTGTCGTDMALTWTYNPEEKQLTISGSGAFNDNMQCGIEARAELTKLVFEDGVTSIGTDAFKDCATLTELIIGKDIKKINGNAFYNCENLATIYNYRPTPTNALSTAFDGVDKFECTLYVLESSVDMYKAADVWKSFVNVIGIEEPIETIEGNYTIYYVDKESQDLSDEVVTLHVPVAPTISGFTFVEWRASGTLADGITLQAVYQADVPSSAPAVYTNPANSAQKLIKNGNVYILTDDKTYTITGQKVK